MRGLVIVGWDAESLLLGFGVVLAIIAVGADALHHRPALEAGAVVSRLWVARGVAWRTLHNLFTNPSLLIPGLLFPLFFFTAFAGGLSRISSVPGFDYPNGYTAFQFSFVLLQSAAFGGVFTGFGIARDFETGFSKPAAAGGPAAQRDRLRLRGRRARAVDGDRRVPHGRGPRGRDERRLERRTSWARIYLLGLLVNVAALLFACGVAMRFRTMQAGPVMQFPVFIVLFFAPVYVPLGLLRGWIHDVATLNPLTRILEAVRGLLAGSPTQTGSAFLVALLLVAAFFPWALRGMRSAERAGLGSRLRGTSRGARRRRP